jgi:hypothetical protein
MNRPILLAYQWLIGISDTSTGALLMIAPVFTLRLMGLHVPPDALPFIEFIGAFVLSVGLACVYGAILMARRGNLCMLQGVWLLTAFTRASVAVFVVTQIVAQLMEPGWVTVATTDATCVVIQAIGPDLRAVCFPETAGCPRNG